MFTNTKRILGVVAATASAPVLAQPCGPSQFLNFGWGDTQDANYYSGGYDASANPYGCNPATAYLAPGDPKRSHPGACWLASMGSWTAFDWFLAFHMHIRFEGGACLRDQDPAYNVDAAQFFQEMDEFLAQDPSRWWVSGDWVSRRELEDSIRNRGASHWTFDSDDHVPKPKEVADRLWGSMFPYYPGWEENWHPSAGMWYAFGWEGGWPTFPLPPSASEQYYFNEVAHQKLGWGSPVVGQAYGIIDGYWNNGATNKWNAITDPTEFFEHGLWCIVTYAGEAGVRGGPVWEDGTEYGSSLALAESRPWRDYDCGFDEY